MAGRMKQKAAMRKENRDRRPRAIARYVRISPRKVKIVIDLIRGKSANEALAILKSAIANAENNLDLNKDDLYVAEIYADQGPTLKRVMPRARGMAFQIRKRTSHITVILDEKK